MFGVMFLTFKINIALNILTVISLICNLISTYKILRSKFKVFKLKSLNILLFITSIWFALSISYAVLALNMLIDNNAGLDFL